jgi:hypothetical protein
LGWHFWLSSVTGLILLVLSSFFTLTRWFVLVLLMYAGIVAECWVLSYQLCAGYDFSDLDPLTYVPGLSLSVFVLVLLVAGLACAVPQLLLNP